MRQAPIKPWERQEGESGKAYEAFVLYRDAGNGRTVSEVVKKLEKSRVLLDRWKSRWNWDERVAAYDLEIDRESKAQVIRDRKKMLDRHIKIAMQVQSKALEALGKLDVEEMSAKDIKEYIRMATDLERLSRMFELGETKSTAEAEGATAETYDLSKIPEKDFIRLVHEAFYFSENKGGQNK